MKKVAIIFLLLGILVAGAYVWVRVKLTPKNFVSQQPKDSSVATKPATSVLDLRPALVTRLQQLVQQGSDGLYHLYVHEVDPDIVNSTLRISKAELVPDTAVMRRMKNLPADIFRMKTDSIYISGIGIQDVISGKVIDLKTIHIFSPQIEVYSHTKSREKKDTQTLYQKLTSALNRISIANVMIENGTLLTRKDQKTPSKFGSVHIQLKDILVDSSTQYDKNRFLFARQASLSIEQFKMPSQNQLYDINIAKINVNANNRLMQLSDFTIVPRYSKAQFSEKVKQRTERYDVSIPSVQLQNTNWWALINDGMLEASSAEINSVKASVYLDRRVPAGKPQLQSFPHQLLMKLPMKIAISKINIRDLDLAYEEFSTASGKAGTLTVNNLKGSITNLTNIPAIINRNGTTHVEATGLLMQQAPVALTIDFDLRRYRTGNFSASLQSLAGFDGGLVNSVGEPLGLFRIKKGHLTELSSAISGNNKSASGKVRFLYEDLHITPLKKDEDKPGGLRKKTVTSFIANLVLIKNDNPKNGTTRTATPTYNRNGGTFFNLIWKTTFVGILQTIGAPERLANQ